MEQEKILTPERLKVIGLVAKERSLSKFYLSGGTALAAFYLNHRLSEDLDFFSFEPVDYLGIQSFMEKVKKELGAKTMRYDRLYDRHLFFLQVPGNDLKIEFTKYPFRPLGRKLKRLSISVDSIRDIAANKLVTITDRFDPKDFVDLFFLLDKFSLKQMRRDAEKKFGMKIGDMLLGSSFANVRRIVALPRMLKSVTIDELKERFAKEATKVGKGLFFS